MKKIINTMLVALMAFTVVSPGVTALATEAQKSDIIEYGTIIESDTPVATTTSSEYTIEEIEETVSVQAYGNNEETMNNYVEPVKVEANAGTHVINVNNQTGYVEYVAETNEVVATSSDIAAPSVETMAVGNEYFIVENGVITSASEANIITLGGAEVIKYMYPTVEDAYNTTNGTTVSGGANTGSYVGTVTYEGKDFVEITISGYTGYMALEDVQIIPSYISMNTSYYFAQDGVWYYASAIDPLVSDEFMVMPTSDAPVWAVEGTKYYSDDNETFTTSEYMGPETYADYQNQAYFQNLSMRSTTGHTASDFKNFLTHKGFTNSEYYNGTQAFFDAEKETGINALLMFSMANLESYYGTSSYAVKCNNYFGRGAYDSNPDNACAGRQFPTPKDAVVAQGHFLNVGFLDQADWRYEGSYVGNKGGGLNAHYASDPEWGQKIGSLAYEADKYLGSNDNNYFKIVEIKGDVPVYTSSSLTTTAKAQGVYMCNNAQTDCIDADNPNDYVSYKIGKQTSMPVRVVVTGETSSAYEIQIETPRNQGASGFETWTYAETGSYPNYEGANNGAEGTSNENYVSNGYINFANEYDTWTGNQMWIPKTVNGVATTSTVANNPIKDTQRGPVAPPTNSTCPVYVSESVNSDGNKVVKSKTSNGSIQCSTTYRGTSSVRYHSTHTYYTSGNKTKQIKYFYNTSDQLYNRDYYTYHSNGETKYYADTNYNTSTGYIKDYKEYYYNTSGVRTQRNEKVYHSNGKAKQLTEYKYDSSNNLTNRDTYKYDTSGRKTYYADTFYAADGDITSYKEYYYNTSGKITQRNEKVYHSNGNAQQLKQYKYTSNGSDLLNLDTYKYDTNGVKTYYADTYYNADNNEIDYYKEYYYNTSGIRTQRNEKDYDYNGNALYKEYLYYDNNGNFMYSDIERY